MKTHKNKLSRLFAPKGVKRFSRFFLPLAFFCTSAAFNAAAQAPCTQDTTLPKITPAYAKMIARDNYLLAHPKMLTDTMWNDMTTRYAAAMKDSSNRALFENWMSHFKNFRDAPIAAKAQEVDRAVDAYMNYALDDSVYHQPNHWATPIECLKKELGDCEDFAILKFYTLKALGVPEEKLHILLVSDTAKSVLSHATLLVNIGNPPLKKQVVLEDDNTWMFGKLNPLETSGYRVYYIINTKDQRFPRPSDFGQATKANTQIATRMPRGTMTNIAQ